jgi:hypothetical protein
MDILALFSHTYDGKNAEGFIDLFVPEATVAMYRAGKLLRDNIPLPSVAMLDSTFKFQEKNGEFVSRHFLSSISLELMADGTMTARSAFTMTSQKTGSSKPTLVGTGEFRDIFVKTPSGWKYARHEIHIDQELPTQER